MELSRRAMGLLWLTEVGFAPRFTYESDPSPALGTTPACAKPELPPLEVVRRAGRFGEGGREAGEWIMY